MSDAAGKTIPRHFMVELARVLEGELCQPRDEVNLSEGPAPLHVLLQTRPPLIAMARELVRQCGDDDVIFANGEDVSLPVAHELLRQRKQTRLVSLGHNLRSKRIRLSRWMSSAYQRVDRFYVLTPSLMRPGDRDRHFLDTADDRFFRPEAASTAQSPPEREKRLIASVGLEQRDYRLLARATQGLSVQVKISGFSRDAELQRRSLPDPMPAHMERGYYSWPDLRRLYQTADLVVVPIRETGYAAGITTILEALAVGLPVIATQTKGLSGALGDASVIRWVPPDAAPALRRAIVELLDDAEAREALARAGELMFRAHHRKDVRIAEIAAALRDLP